MDAIALIDRYYPKSDALKDLLLLHSHQVTERCQTICRCHPELKLDSTFLQEAAMLHDIGIKWCHAPTIFCTGTEPYICHGLIGARLLRQEGHEQHARVCERHTGTGLTREQIERQHLPLPLEGQYEPETWAEQVICYADKFYSKSHPERQLTVEQAAQSLARFGDDGVKKFLSWAAIFE